MHLSGEIAYDVLRPAHTEIGQFALHPGKREVGFKLCARVINPKGGSFHCSHLFKFRAMHVAKLTGALDEIVRGRSFTNGFVRGDQDPQQADYICTLDSHISRFMNELKLKLSFWGETMQTY
jgi:hypothetical protein